MAVEFNEPVFASSSRGGAPAKPSTIEQAIIKTGFVNSKEGARIVLGVFALLCIGISIFLFIQSSAPTPTPTPESYPVWPR